MPNRGLSGYFGQVLPIGFIGPDPLDQEIDLSVSFNAPHRAFGGIEGAMGGTGVG